ncbi:hypothetical protein H0H93_001357 [Arthromyces matolae]|nr:hypothetical protein H0H93_001357 [Arthromyces matolae]
MFIFRILPSFLIHIILLIPSIALAVNIDKRVVPEQGVIASVRRDRLHFEYKAPTEPMFMPRQTSLAYVVFVDETRCLEIAPVDGISTQNPYFVSFESLYLGNSVEWLMGSVRNKLGVYLQPGTLVMLNGGGTPLVLRLKHSRGTHLKGFVYDMIRWALLFMEEKKVRPTIEDAKRMLDVPVAGGSPTHFHQLLWELPADGTPAEFREGMIGTVSHENFEEDLSLPSLPWERRRRFPLVLFLNQNHWCLEIVPDRFPFNTNEYFISFEILGLQDLVMNLTSQTVPMGVLLRRIHLIPAGGNPPDVKSLPTSALQDKQLPKEAFGRIYAALKYTYEEYLLIVHESYG